MSLPLILLLALLLDAVFGEPRLLWDRFTHPAVLFGKLIGFADERANYGDNRKLKGTVVFGGLCLGAISAGLVLSALPFGWLIELLCAAILVAQKSLTEHVSAVANALRLSNVNARISVARIVGRDTTDMDDSQISRAAIESAAENLSDGVIAPVFWFLLFGLPGLFLYKITNTADSMIGYRTPRHAEFGWAAARFDDLLNYLPARITALLILVVCGNMHALKPVRIDAPKHRSPNAGWPEAAMAQCLNIALAGPRSYDGEARDFPYVNPTGNHSIGPDEIDATVRVLWKTWGAAIGLCAVLALF
ncbi:MULTISPECIES: adenosylcobinamide-phosphate synthase CbiB [Falsihalocynthiibacter]|uniref:adenosylcobinamide-phosphate synthase CbiB n=1 Tax=Falsihalocynthiibacter TaxID=2854182 RepID=UPI0030024163